MKEAKDKTTGLSARQAAFVQEYLIDLNQTQAAIRAGYKVDRAPYTASRLMSFPQIKRAIQAAMAARQKRTEITQDRVLQEIARIAFADVRSLYDDGGRLKSPETLSDDAAAALAAVDVSEIGGDDAPLVVTKKAKLHDKVAALTLAARHLGMLNDKLKIDGETTVIIKDYTGRKAQG